MLYLTKGMKYKKIVEDIVGMQKGQPILVGTTSIENSEYLSKLLKQRKLNIKY